MGVATRSRTKRRVAVVEDGEDVEVIGGLLVVVVVVVSRETIVDRQGTRWPFSDLDRVATDLWSC
jgi:hypothetical protein